MSLDSLFLLLWEVFSQPLAIAAALTTCLGVALALFGALARIGKPKS